MGFRSLAGVHELLHSEPMQLEIRDPETLGPTL